nr:PREDICTED: uncharacterized protein LOC107076236 [Lepisosteus oculatus]
MNGLHGTVHLLFFICTAVREAAGTGAAVRPVGVGDTVVLPCDLQLGYEVMWFVQRDETLFLGLLASKSQAETVNFNYASDSCFSPALNSSTGSIDLRIRNVSRTDLGLFYCAGKAQGRVAVGTGTRLVCAGGQCEDDHRQARSPFELEKSCFIILLLVPPLSVLITSGCVFGLFHRTGQFTSLGGAGTCISPEKRESCRRNVQEVDHCETSDFIAVPGRIRTRQLQ